MIRATTRPTRSAPQLIRSPPPPMSKPRQHYAFVATKWMTASSYVTFMTGAVNSVIITHALGPRLYGVYSYLVWMITFVVGLTAGGLNLTAIRTISAVLGPDRSAPSGAALATFALLRKLLYKLLALAALALWVSTLFPDVYPTDLRSRLYIYLAFVAFCAAAKGSYMFSISASKGFMVFETEAIGNIATGLTTPLVGLALLRMHQGLPAFMALLGASMLAQLAIARVIMHRRELVPARHIPVGEASSRIGKLLRWNVLLSLVDQIRPQSIDTYLLGYLSLTVAVGQYNIAANLSRAGTSVLVAGFSAILLPHLSRVQAEEGMQRVQDVFVTAACVYQGIGILVAGAGYLVAEYIILTLYGKAFSGAISAFEVMAAVSGVTMPLGAYSAVLVATDNVRLRLAYAIGMTMIALTSSLTLVLRYGYEGALASILVGGMVSYAFAVLLAFRMIGLRFPFRRIATQWLSALLPLFALHELAPHRSTLFSAFGSAIAFAAAFTVLSVNSGGWRREDLKAASRQSALLAKLLGAISFVRL